MNIFQQLLIDFLKLSAWFGDLMHTQGCWIFFCLIMAAALGKTVVAMINLYSHRVTTKNIYDYADQIFRVGAGVFLCLSVMSPYDPIEQLGGGSARQFWLLLSICNAFASTVVRHFQLRNKCRRENNAAS